MFFDIVFNKLVFVNNLNIIKIRDNFYVFDKLEGSFIIEVGDLNIVIR